MSGDEKMGETKADMNFDGVSYPTCFVTGSWQRLQSNVLG